MAAGNEKGVSKMFKNYNANAPMWVNVVYKLLSWIERHVCSRLDGLVSKRFTLMDRYCQCDNCLDKRARMSRSLQWPSSKDK